MRRRLDLDRADLHATWTGGPPAADEVAIKFSLKRRSLAASGESFFKLLIVLVIVSSFPGVQTDKEVPHMMSETSKCSHAGGATSQKRRRSRFKRIGGRGKHSYLWFDSLLSQLQIKAMQDFAASKEVQGQTFAAGTSDGDERDRVSRIALLGRPSSQPPPEIPAWLDRKLRQACRQVHATMGNDICPLGMDSRGLWTPRFEPVQYAEYRTGGHYAAWHTDADADESDLMDLRCVTVVLMLSDAEAYEVIHIWEVI